MAAMIYVCEMHCYMAAGRERGEVRDMRLPRYCSETVPGWALK
jgi:hypothetical protein